MTYLTTKRLASIDEHLTDRDRQLTREVGRLRLLSHRQLRRLFFAGDGEPSPGVRVGQRRLARLVQLGVLARLDRRVGGVRAGSEGYVYGLGPAGQKLLSRWNGEAAGRARAVHEPGGPFVAHTLACSELYVALAEAEREHRLELLEHQAEPTTWRTRVGPYGQPLTLRPDGFVRLGVAERELFWFVEIDRATESLTAISRQGRAYLDYYASGARADVMPRVAWLTPDTRRADALRSALHDLGSVSADLFMAARQDAALPLLSGEAS
jgi:hypothetical protein